MSIIQKLNNRKSQRKQDINNLVMDALAVLDGKELNAHNFKVFSSRLDSALQKLNSFYPELDAIGLDPKSVLLELADQGYFTLDTVLDFTEEEAYNHMDDYQTTTGSSQQQIFEDVRRDTVPEVFVEVYDAIPDIAGDGLPRHTFKFHGLESARDFVKLNNVDDPTSPFKPYYYRVFVMEPVTELKKVYIN